jgi:predicted metal-dependent enzyme (double-stranded beta helix superfamily)
MTADSASSAARPCADAEYGLAPKAHAVVSAWAEQVDVILAEHDLDAVPEHVAEALTPLLATPDLLCDALRAPGEDRYRKHRLYADPAGRFTLLALIWLPGQGTVVHGHTAWCSVGVYEGEPNVVTYDCQAKEDGTHAADETCNTRHGPGALCAVRPGLGDVHRIYNDTDATMITLHAYGCDLVEDPDAINLVVNLAN